MILKRFENKSKEEKYIIRMKLNIPIPIREYKAMFIVKDFSFASFFAGLVYNLLWIIFIPISKRQEKKLQLLLAEKEG